MRYEVVAKLIVEADGAEEAIRMFDSEYRDPLTVVHLHAELAMSDWCSRCGSQPTGERRNGQTLVLR